jgi:type I restriction enzyme R subunit
MKKAFHQINRYHHESYDAGAGLFQYVQLFIISNGVNTKYFANNKNQSFQQTFYWTDKENNRISDMSEFTDTFL